MWIEIFICASFLGFTCEKYSVILTLKVKHNEDQDSRRQKKNNVLTQSTVSLKEYILDFFCT